MKSQKNRLVSAVLVLALLAFALSFLPFAPTIVVAVIFALGISYWLDNIYIKYSQKKQKVVMASIVMAGLLLIGTSLTATARLYNMTIGTDREKTYNSLQENKKIFFEKVESARQSLNEKGLKISPIREENLMKDWSKFAETGVLSTLTRMGDFLSALTNLAINLMVFSIFLIVMVNRRQQILELLSDTSLWGDLRLKKIYGKAQESGYGSVFTIFTVGMAQTLVMTIGASAVGFKEWPIIFTATFFASFFPVVGTAPVGLLLALISFFQGDATAGIIMVCIAGFAGMIDNILKPFMVAHTGPQMNGFMALVGIVGAVILFGLPGLFVGPFLMIFIPSLKSEAADLLRTITRARKNSELYFAEDTQIKKAPDKSESLLTM